MQLVRDSHYYNLTLATMTQLEMELHVYSGTQTTSRPVTPTANIITSTFPAIGGTNPRAMINIAPYIIDEIDLKYSQTLATLNGYEKGVWFDYRTRPIISGTPGSWTSYVSNFGLPGYFRKRAGSTTGSDGAQGLLISQGPANGQDTVLYIPDGERLTIPVANYASGSVDEVTFYNGTTHTTAVSAPGAATTSTTTVVYAQEPIALTTTSIQRFLDPAYTKLVNVERVTEYRETPQKIVFVNSYGVWQEMWFFGRKRESFSVTGITARRDTVFYDTYDPSRPEYLDYNKKGREEITLNSGWQVEANNIFFQELMLSQQCYWIQNEAGTLYTVPVRPKTSSFELKSQNWDKMINYTINFEIATDYTL